MAGNEIRYNVKVDASGANRALSQFGRTAERAGRDAAEALDDTASAGEKIRAALQASAEAADAELREAAAAADALKLALGDAADQFDTSQLVAEINRGGVTFDEIRADADKFADTLRQIDGIRVKGVNDGLTKTKTALDGVRDSSDQSRSVLANMAGNAAQDLGELGGVVGTAGVAIGQLAEYATEGNISLRNLAGVAGPMLGIAAAVQLVSSQLQNMKQTDAFNAEQAKKYTDAIADAGTEASTLRTEIEDTGEILTRVGQDNPMGRIFSREETIDIVGLLNDAGVTLNDVMALFDQYHADIAAGTVDHDAFKESLSGLGVAGDDIDHVFAGLLDNFIAFNTEVTKADEMAKFTAADVSSMGAEMGKLRAELAATDQAWARLIQLQYEGKGASQESLDLWNQLADTLDLLPPEMAAAFNDKYNVFLDEQAKAIAESRDQARGYINTIKEIGRVTGSAEWGRTGIEGATTAYEQYRHYVTGDRRRVAESEEAWDGLGDSIEGAGETLLDLSSPQGRAVYDSLDELGQSIVPDLAKAFDDSDGDINRFRRSVNTLSAQTLTRLQDELGVSEEDARLMIAELGLMPEQVDTFYELSGDEEAKQQLALLQGVIDTLPPDVQTSITQKILLGDYKGAVAEVQTYANQHPAWLELQLATGLAEEKIRQIAARIRGLQSSIANVFSFSAMSVAPSSAAAATATSRGAPAPMGTAAAVTPVNVHIHTAVVGNRWDVERVVAGAVRSGVRLAGRRQLERAR